MKEVGQAFSVFLIFVTCLLPAAYAQPQQRPVYVITKGTEHKIWVHAGGAKACFQILSLSNNQPARAHFRRTRAGKNKDLDIHTGNACWDAKAPVYVLYATAVDEDIKVIQYSGPIGVAF
ncbi:hypothetical protein [Rhodoplanes roseus]|uniref:hypothetical protein n=1 Tax=Rhodoplanes roseus TaxID=29409 RepID=UPI0011B64F91|nr:hypothetical protein [Rhodoplanes roseus]